MGQFQRLSPMTAYYLRKLIENKHNQLTWDSPDPNVPITLDNILKHLKTKGSEASRKLDLLDRFVFLHQSFASTYPDDSMQVRDIEAKIYECLELQWNLSRGKVTNTSSAASAQPPCTIKDLINQLNGLRKKSTSLLGPKITFKFFLETRPENDWCLLFNLSETRPISFNGDLMKRISNEQSILFEQWINSFTEKCLEIIADFDHSENKQSNQSLFSNTPWQV